MNFKEWSNKYYPNESEKILHKMSHAWASAHVNFAMSKGCKNCKEPFNHAIATDSLKEHSKQCAEKVKNYPKFKRDCMQPIGNR